jgi:hypothetical protein
MMSSGQIFNGTIYEEDVSWLLMLEKTYWPNI